MEPHLYRALQVSGSNRHCCRSATSTYSCIAETVLSTIVFVYVMIGIREFQFPRSSVGLCVALCAGCGIWNGVSHIVCEFSVQETVHKIVSNGRHETSRPGTSGRGNSPGLNGLDPFEYHDVVAISLNVTAVISLFLTCACFFVVVGFLFVICIAVMPFSLFGSPSLKLQVLFCVLFLFWVGYYSRFLYKFGVVGMSRNFRKALLERPCHADVQGLLLVSGAMYALFLCFHPVPSLWRWGLITTHTARAIKVYVALEGRIGVVVEAHGDSSRDHML